MDSSAARPDQADRFFRRSLALTAGIKLLLALLIPLTGDEAYFIQWGRELAGSYYDHGPMTGWWIWLTLLTGDHVFAVRLPAVVASLFTGWLIWRLLRSHDRASAAWAAAIYLWSPAALLSVFMTTDTPLLVFSVLAVAAGVRADRSNRVPDYLLTGALLGLAFLSKYFAVLLGVAFAAWWWLLAERRRPLAVLWVFLGVLPFAAQHVYWNYHHSWTNVMFNVLTRQEGDRSAWYNPLVLVVVALWLIGPPAVVAFRALKRSTSEARVEAWRRLRRSPWGIALAAFVVPHLVFLLVSLDTPVGVHWLLSFQPFFFVAIAVFVPIDSLQAVRRASVIFGGAHVTLVAVALLLPLSLISSHRSYSSVVLGLHPDEVLEALEAYRPHYRLATPSYAKSALLEFHANEPVIVLGPGSFHGRQDDLRTDFRQLDGADILVLTKPGQAMETERRWFSESEVVDLPVRDTTFTVLLGRNFRYDVYREAVLRPVADHYYRMPAWLARWSSGCFFRERYSFPTAAADTRAAVR